MAIILRRPSVLFFLVLAWSMKADPKKAVAEMCGSGSQSPIKDLARGLSEFVSDRQCGCWTLRKGCRVIVFSWKSRKQYRHTASNDRELLSCATVYERFFILSSVLPRLSFETSSVSGRSFVEWNRLRLYLSMPRSTDHEE